MKAAIAVLAILAALISAAIIYAIFYFDLIDPSLGANLGT